MSTEGSIALIPSKSGRSGGEWCGGETVWTLAVGNELKGYAVDIDGVVIDRVATRGGRTDHRDEGDIFAKTSSSVEGDLIEHGFGSDLDSVDGRESGKVTLRGADTYNKLMRIGGRIGVVSPSTEDGLDKVDGIGD